ncbi:MAG: cell division protein FtsZ [Clostridiales bacterium]|nr:cell division protein FtsZ [Clostridiales bacterium]MDE6618131.1 cell division protein FtsZ [Clostridiales bacterium]
MVDMQYGTNFQDDDSNSPVKVMIVGVGGGGSNAVDNMIEAQVKVNVFMAINTDKQALRISKATRRVQIGSNITKGYGAGANPEKGRLAAEECRETLTKLIKDIDLVFITAGMGGGTGTGAAPVIAEIAHNLDKLVVAFVTTPFKFEGEVRMRNAQAGIAELRKWVDSIIIVPNERLASVAKDLTTQEAFKYADDILRQGVQALTDIIVNPGKINVDFADIHTILENGGDAIMAIGRASGANRAVEAVKRAVNNTVLDTSIEGATRAIVQVEGREVKMNEVSQAVELVRDICAKEANIVFGHAIVPELKDQLQVTIIATGFNHGSGAAAKPQPQQPMPQTPIQPMIPQNPAMQPRQMQQPVPPQQPQGNVPPLFAQQYRQQPQRPIDDDYVSMDDDSEQSWLDKLKKRR